MNEKDGDSYLEAVQLELGRLFAEAYLDMPKNF